MSGVAHANHYTIPNGSTIRFVAKDGAVYTRTVVNSVQVGESDIQIGVLDSDLPASIKWYKLLPQNWRDYMVKSETGIPALTRKRKR